MSGEIRIEGFEDLQAVARAFVAGELPHVIVCGPPGTMKTTTVSRAMPTQHIRESGMVSPYVLYQRLYQNKDQLLVMDDVEEFLSRTPGQELLRSLTETDGPKQIQWRTRNMGKDNVPDEFVTSTRCLIITNRLGNTPVWQALQSRCHVVRYEPSWDEFLFTVKELGVFDDDELLDYAAENQAVLGNPDLRRLMKARAVKQSGLRDHWKDVLGRPVEGSSKWETNAAERTQAVHSLLEDPSFGSVEERVRVFVERGMGSRSTFFHYASRIRRAASRSFETEVTEAVLAS